MTQPRMTAAAYRASLAAPGGAKGGSVARSGSASKNNTPTPSKREGKYNAKGAFVLRTTGAPCGKGDDGAVFMASAAQAERYRQLLQLQKLGLIERLRIEVPYVLSFGGVHICTYRADAEYIVTGPRATDSYVVVEDVKGMVTPEYALKKKLMRANNTPIFEIPAKDVSQWTLRVPPPFPPEP